MRALSRLADVAGFWTLDRTTITGRSAVILRQHTTPFRPMIVPFDDLELVLSKLEKLEPPHTRKFPRVNAQDSKLAPARCCWSVLLPKSWAVSFYATCHPYTRPLGSILHAVAFHGPILFNPRIMQRLITFSMDCAHASPRLLAEAVAVVACPY
jgi:hypothetical protein